MNTAVELTNRQDDNDPMNLHLFEDDFEESQIETPWEIFYSEMNNWNEIAFYSAEF